MRKTKNIFAIMLLFVLSGMIAYSAKPLKNADVTITCSNGKTLSSRTDASGSFSVSVADLDCDGFTVATTTEVCSWSFGASNSGSMSMGSGGGSGKVSMQDFHFTVRESPTKQSLGKRDIATGQASGKRQYQPLIIRKQLCPNGDCSSGAACDMDLSCDGTTLSGKVTMNDQAVKAGWDLKKATK